MFPGWQLSAADSSEAMYSYEVTKGHDCCIACTCTCGVHLGNKSVGARGSAGESEGCFPCWATNPPGVRSP